MKTVTRLLVVALVLVVSGLTVPATAQTQDNTAVAVNTKDGKSVFKLAFSVKKATGEVDSTNTAVAYASCTECKTVAAAIQVVLVSGEVDSATPENVAIAINYQCTECETMALAFQFVYGDGQELQFTDEGKAKLHALKKRFHDLKQRDDLTLQQLADEIADIATDVQAVVETETEVKKFSPGATTTTSTTAPTVSTTTSVAGSSASPSSTTSTTSSPATTTTTAPPSSTTTSPPSTAAATTTAAP